MSMTSNELAALRRFSRNPQLPEIIDDICRHLKWIAFQGAIERGQRLIALAHDSSRHTTKSARLGREAEEGDEECPDTESATAADVPVGNVNTPHDDKGCVKMSRIQTIALYDPHKAEQQLRGELPKSENALEDYLNEMATPGSEMRELWVPPLGSADACEKLVKEFPNLSNAAEQIAGAVRLAERQQRFVQLPRLLLNGPPGCGKTELIRQVAATLGLPIITITMSALHAEFELAGCNRVYRGAEPGRLIKYLLSLSVANPIYLFDEAELGLPMHYGPLLSFLEDSWFTDTFLEMPFRTEYVNKIFTTNNSYRLTPAIRSRMTKTEGAQPSPVEMRTLVQRIYTKLIDAKPLFSEFSGELASEVIDALVGESLRGVRMRLEEAILRAAFRTPDASNLSVSLRDLLPAKKKSNYVFPERRV